MTELLQTLPAGRTAAPSRRILRGFAPVALTAAFVLAGCAAGADEPTEPNGSTAEEAPSEEAPSEESPEGEEPSGTVQGTATVGGTTYDITELRNCEPLQQEAIESSLELQGFGEAADGERVQIDVYIQSIGGSPLDVVAWSGPEGVYGTQEHADVQLAGDRVSGSATMVDSFTLEEELVIEYDLAVPSELIACR